MGGFNRLGVGLAVPRERLIPMCQVAGDSRYKGHPDVTQMSQAKAIVSARMPNIRLPRYTEVQRWMVFDGGEDAFRAEYLGFDGDVSRFQDTDKLAVLNRYLGDALMTQTGVAFAFQWKMFQECLPFEQWRTACGGNIDGIEAKMIVRGIVQKCGTRGALTRLFNLVRYLETTSIGVRNMESDPNAMELIIKGDLISVALMHGLLAPFPASSTNLSQVDPNIFHVVDIGWELAPHNMVVFAGGTDPVVLPMGAHLYTINIEEIVLLLDNASAQQTKVENCIVDVVRNKALRG